MNDYLLLALIELGALALLVSVTFPTLLYLRRRKLHAAVQAAAKKLSEDEEDRQRTLTAILSGVHRLPESVSAGLSTQLMQCERTVLRQCFDILLSPDPASAAKLSDTLLAGLDDYLRKCAAPNMPRTEISAPESAGMEAAAVPEEGEKLPYWMSKLEKGELPKEDEVPPEVPANPEAFRPASTGWIEQPREEEPEPAPAERAWPAAEFGAPLVEPAGPPETPEIAVPAATREEAAPQPGAADFTEEIGGLLDTYEMEHAPTAVVAAAEPKPPPAAASESSGGNAFDLTEPSPLEDYPERQQAEDEGAIGGGESPGRPDALSLEREEADAAETGLDSTILPPSPPSVTVEDLMTEFGLAPPLPDEPHPSPAEEPAVAPPAIPPQEAAASSSEAPAGDVDALLAEFGFHVETPPVTADAKPMAAPAKKPVLSYVEGSVAVAAEAPQADAAAVDALLAEFGFHDETEMQTQPAGAAAEASMSEPARELPDASQADPAAVEALLAEFGFVPDTSATPQPAEKEPEAEAKAAAKRRGRKKTESPESGT